MSQKQLTRQELFSNYLQLLNISNYADPESRLSNFGVRSTSANSLLRILETIALCMVTGGPGDVVASAFFITPQQKFILLSKNANPSSQDLKDAVVLIDLLQNPGSESMLDILPFIAYRGASGVQKRLEKLSKRMKACRQDLLNNIQAYTVGPPGRLGLFKSEFPEMGDEFFLPYRKAFVGETSSEVKMILQDVTKTCMTSVNFVNDQQSSFRKFTSVVSAAAALGKSKFFHHYTEAQDVVKTSDKKLSKLWRNIDKISQYIRINDAILQMKQRGPFMVKWVTNTDFMEATDFEFKNLKLDNVWNTIDKIRKSNVEQSFNQENVRKHLRNMNPFWNEEQMKPRYATTTLHAELRLIVYLELQARKSSHTSSSTLNAQDQQAIGCSKRSCLVCTWTMEEINKSTKVTYLTAGSHTGVYATSAQIGPILGLDPQGDCGERVFKRVSQTAQDVVQKLCALPDDSAGFKPGHRYKNSEDYASASDPDGEGEPDKSSRSYDFVPN